MEQVNRVADDYKEWLKREEQLKKLFPGTLSTNRGFLYKQLRFYEGLRTGYKGRLNEMEKLTLSVLARERKGLVKKLYPNFYVRLFRNTANLAIRGLKYAMQARADRFNADPAAAVKELLRTSGFSGVISKLEQSVATGLKAIRLGDAHFVSEKEMMDYQLMVVLNPDGRYSLDGYTATLTGADGLKRSHYFTPEGKELISSDQARQLLQGRAVRVGELSDGILHQKWIQLDLTDKNSTGKHRVKTFAASYGFDLEKTLKELPIGRQGTENLMAGLEQGKAMDVLIKTNGMDQKVTLVANPQARTIDAFDEKGKKVDLKATPTLTVSFKNTAVIRQSKARKL